MSPRRVAIVGIDGSGKSSVIARMRDLAPDLAAWTAVSCPDFHHNENAPLHELSRQLEALSDAADEVGAPVIKAATLYLRMTLYGPVEHFLATTYGPEVLVCERHPMIETLVYAPLYQRLAGMDRPDRDAVQRIVQMADQRVPGTRRALAQWQAAEAARTGLGGDLWTTLDEVVALLTRGTAAALDGFAAAYRTALPETVLWLDTSPEEAARRCAARGVRETHEQVGYLAALRDNYRRVGEQLSADLDFHRVEITGSDDPGEVARRCLRYAGLPEPVAVSAVSPPVPG
jgi:thymidylate kinase